jgi:hypothetical protein
MNNTSVFSLICGLGNQMSDVRLRARIRYVRIGISRGSSPQVKARNSVPPWHRIVAICSGIAAIRGGWRAPIPLPSRVRAVVDRLWLLVSAGWRSV